MDSGSLSLFNIVSNYFWPYYPKNSILNQADAILTPRNGDLLWEFEKVILLIRMLLTEKKLNEVKLL